MCPWNSFSFNVDNVSMAESLINLFELFEFVFEIRLPGMHLLFAIAFGICVSLE